jgi:hypothetical protein
MKTTSLRFQKSPMSEKIQIAETSMEMPESRRVVAFGIRIDARGSRVRVDTSKPLMPGWEAIDGGDGFATITDAKNFARRWVAAAKEQVSFSPRLTP